MDSHFHIWELGKFPQYQFPPSDSTKIYRNFSLDDYQKEFSQTPVTGAVFVQVANNCLEEAKWVCEQAQSHSWLRGVVAGLTLDHGKEQLLKEIGQLKAYRQFCGVRHTTLQDENGQGILKKPIFDEACQVLVENDLTLDLPLHPQMIPDAIELARKHRMLKIVVDHMAKPSIRDGGSVGWEEGMEELAKCHNVYVKLSGMVTEASEGWKDTDFKPYVQKIINWFEPSHCMFGSDWPVCLMNADSYSTVYSQVVNCLPLHLRDSDIHTILQTNCLKFYRITAMDKERQTSSAEDVDLDSLP